MGFLAEFFEKALNDENVNAAEAGSPVASNVDGETPNANENPTSKTLNKPPGGPKSATTEEEASVSASSFEELSEEQLEAHLRVDRYGEFSLTDAVRPSFDLKVVPKAGYRREVYTDQESGAKIPVLMASASREKLFDVFLDLIEPLGNVVDVVLESSHEREDRKHDDMYREHIDAPVLKSVLYEYEDLLLNDGCCGMAVLNSKIPNEVQFDEHKLLIIYGSDLGKYEQILESHGLDRDDDLRFITEAEHVHSSSDGYIRQFGELKTELGMDRDYVA